MDLVEHFRVIAQNWWRVLIVAVLAAGGVYLWSSHRNSVYESNTVMSVTPAHSDVNISTKDNTLFLAATYAQLATSQPGSIEATIENAERTKGFAFSVTLEDAQGRIVKDEPAQGSATWARVNVRPGQYRLVVNATSADDKPVSASTVVVVKSSEVARPAVKLPLA